MKNGKAGSSSDHPDTQATTEVEEVVGINYLGT